MPPAVISPRTPLDPLDRAIIRDVALVCAAAALVGASFGAIAVGEGLPFWLPVLMSLVVFAGASQLVFVGLVAAGGGLVTAVLAGLLVNLRHLPFGFAVGGLLAWRRAPFVVVVVAATTVAAGLRCLGVG